MIEHSSHAALDVPSRLLKAEKIRQLLATGKEEASRLLEIGTGSGTIAHYFATLPPPGYSVAAVDVADQRQVRDAYDFQVYDGDRLPFADASFDIVISNHVIEHVGTRDQQARHLREIGRVLKQSGRAYLASPSRWQFIEPHFRLMALSWIPRRWRDPYVRLAGRGDRYDCDPMSHAEIEAMLRASGLHFRNINVAALHATLKLESHGTAIAWLATRIPARFLCRLYRFSPTMVYLLQKQAGSIPGAME